MQKCEVRYKFDSEIVVVVRWGSRLLSQVRMVVRPWWPSPEPDCGNRKCTLLDLFWRSERGRIWSSLEVRGVCWRSEMIRWRVLIDWRFWEQISTEGFERAEVFREGLIWVEREGRVLSGWLRYYEGGRKQNEICSTKDWLREGDSERRRSTEVRLGSDRTALWYHVTEHMREKRICIANWDDA